ncbi:NUDIX domain-containing protein [Euzebya tangerina]|uniref:Ppx/GppA phosphatase family protein n=1 Tax=Euzebya tangerina TaxID=591198 RepID=UPI0013C36689|nr:NUDIX domain-containing protein [Euzebya tangerina]
MSPASAGGRVVAAVDVGTNSVRLLVLRESGDGPSALRRELRLVRLGEGVDQTGRLAPAAIERTVAAISEFAGMWEAAGAEAVRITTTSAARDADNVDDLAARVRETTGVRLEVISGEEEGRLAFAGATAGLRDEEPVAVLDIGGGSTEMIVGTTKPRAWTSRQLGSVRLTERVLLSDPPTEAEVARAREVIDVELDAILAETAPASGARLVAVAGTATTVAALHLGADTYPEGQIHGLVLTTAEVGTIADTLLARSAAEIARAGGVQPGREDVIAGGALILHRTMERLGFDEVTISESDSLDGSAARLLEEQRRAAAAAEELVEVVERDGSVVDVITRAEMRRRGARHRCTFIAVVRSSGAVVVHQRAAWKDVSPSRWDLAFGGVCDVGEGWLESATRELEEEAGVSGVELTELGQVAFEGEGFAIVGRVYAVLYDGPVSPDDGEVVALDEIPIEALDQWIATTELVDDSPVVVPPLLVEWWQGR